jgi:hypothetical protein
VRRQQRLQLLRQLDRLVRPQSLAYMSHRLRKARLAHRLHEVVERVRLERAHRELVVRSDEDDRRHSLRAVRP